MILEKQGDKIAYAHIPKNFKGFKGKRVSSVYPELRRGFKAPKVGRTELKVIDTAANEYGIDQTGSVTLIGGVATGTDYTNRIGRRILLKSVQLRGYCQPKDTTAGPQTCRVMIVYDRAPNGVIATLADIFTVPTSGQSMLNLTNRDRFRVISDTQFAMGQISTTATQTFATGTLFKNMNIYRRLNHLVTFGGTAATIGSIETGALYLVTIGDNTAASTNGALLEATIRVRFTDA